MTPEERAVLERARVATLATADGDGHPHAVPICYAVLEDNGGDSSDELDPNPRLVSAIDEKPKSTRNLRRVRDVRANPHATALVDYYSEDWSRLAWVQIRGHARVVEADRGNDTIHDAAVAALESKYDQYADHDLAERAVLEIRVDRTLSWGALEAYAE